MIASCLGACVADEYDHNYEQGEKVVLWVNRIGPYHNPQETYMYYSLPFCSTKPVEQLEHRWDALGEVLEGNDLVASGLSFHFREAVTDYSKICSITLGEGSASQLEYAVRNHYWYQFFLDDLPIWGMVGELTATEALEGADELRDTDGDALVYTHKNFVLAYNGRRIIQVNLTSENPVPISIGASIEFSYSVSWVPTDISFYNRFDRYLDYDFFEHQIHWFSIFNSFMMVIFLTGIVALILMRTLRKDYAKFARESVDIDDLDQQELDESGWKQVHGDVFRPPAYLSLFCALVGTGWQLATVTFFMILFATATSLYMGRGAIILSFLIAYCLASVVAGYSSGGLYSRLRGQAWISCLLFTVVLFPSLCLGLTVLLNCVAMFYHSLATVPLMSLVIVGLIWFFVAVPLCAMGTIVGRNWAGLPNDPCRVNTIPRLIPERRWFARPSILIALGGVLPFGSIFIEMCKLGATCCKKESLHFGGMTHASERFQNIYRSDATYDVHCQ